MTHDTQITWRVGDDILLAMGQLIEACTAELVEQRIGSQLTRSELLRMLVRHEYERRFGAWPPKPTAKPKRRARSRKA